MTDEELANAIVAAGAAVAGNNKSLEHRFTVDYFDWMTNKDIVRDWRVAGAMMEKIGWCKLYHIIGIQHLAKRVCPRDINEACIMALEDRE